jgi:3-mercaptopyruvate sulfurtransferase SseA
MYLRPAAPDEDVPYHRESGRADYEKVPIPNASFLDLGGDLLDPDSPYFFMMPSQGRFVAAMESHGIGEGLRMVLYSAGSIMGAT